MRGRIGRGDATVKRESAARDQVRYASATTIQKVYRGALGRWDAEMEAQWQSLASLGEVLPIHASSNQVEEYRRRGEARRAQLAEQRRKEAERYALYEKQWLVQERKRHDCAVMFQRVIRGFVGRKRAMWRKHMMQAEQEQVSDVFTLTPHLSHLYLTTAPNPNPNLNLNPNPNP